MNKITKNPLIRFIGIVAILYYGLLHNKESPDSLGNRLSPKKIQTNISEISTKSTHIITNVQKAKQIIKEK